MQLLNQNLRVPSIDPSLRALFESLVGESYARESKFVECTLDEVGQKIEMGREVIELPDWAPLKPSYDKCVALYCEILMECEGLGKTLPAKPIGALLSPSEHELTPTALVEAVEGPSGKSTDLPSFQDLSEQTLRNLGVTGPLISAPNEPLPKVAEDSAGDLGSQLMNPSSKEFLQAAHYFEAAAQSGSMPFASDVLNRMTDFSLCACIEGECAARFQGAKQRLWTQRVSALTPLLDGDLTRAELVTALKEALNTWASDRPEWLLDGRFPYSAFIANVRAWLGATDPMRNEITSLDGAMLLLLLSQDRPEAGYQLTNWLGARGLTWTQTVEAAFRLCRVYKLRLKVWSPTSQFEESHRILLQEDVQALIPILSKLTFADETEQEAA